ncbi:hypothetical protein [Burkholderia cepacia]|uniref:hypothetical protein n=1 Tax=Burkholderia cepacia TaxID=292 RepID=UPI0021AB44E1|nr:hypothetical protein [Burkholderia cepacia]
MAEALIRRIKCRASPRQATAGHRLSLAAYVAMTFDQLNPPQSKDIPFVHDRPIMKEYELI